MTDEIKCKQCKKGEGHFHYENTMTDFWQPTQTEYVCLCGKPHVHYHYEKVSIWIEEKIKS